MRKPRYKIIDNNPILILIKDLCEEEPITISVTNGAEQVVEELLSLELLQNKRLLYIDTNGDTDEILHDNKKFLNFKIIEGA